MNARLKKSSDPGFDAWHAHCCRETGNGDVRHFPHSLGGDASFRSNDIETYYECRVAGCDWSWRQELKS